MALESAFFPGSVDDTEWALWNTLLSFEGSVGGAVTAASGDRRVFIASYRVAFQGRFARDTEQSEVTFPANASSNPRIDRVILRINHQAGTLILTSKQGSPAANPQPPELAGTTTGTSEFSFARVLINPGQGSLSAGNITNEATPPHRGFYFINSINTAPRPAGQALMYYTADRSLRVAHDGQYVELADARPSQPVLVATAAAWSSSLNYTLAGRKVTVRGRPVRNPGNSAPSLLGTLPAAVRPPFAVDGSCWQNTGDGARQHGFSIETNGQITIYPGTDGPIAAGIAVRFHASYSLTTPLTATAF